MGSVAAPPRVLELPRSTPLPPPQLWETGAVTQAKGALSLLKGEDSGKRWWGCDRSEAGPGKAAGAEPRPWRGGRMEGGPRRARDPPRLRPVRRRAGPGMPAGQGASERSK